MCYRVVCKECGKYSWGGCGKHLESVFANIEKGKHCTCRPWPGVKISSESSDHDQGSGSGSGSGSGATTTNSDK